MIKLIICIFVFIFITSCNSNNSNDKKSKTLNEEKNIKFKVTSEISGKIN